MVISNDNERIIAVKIPRHWNIIYETTEPVFNVMPLRISLLFLDKWVS